MKAGDRVRLTGDSGDVRNGLIILCSPNEDSLMVKLDDGFRTREGIYVDMMPLLRTDGVYRELMTGEAVDVVCGSPSDFSA
jgi:hypothetical protein